MKTVRLTGLFLLIFLFAFLMGSLPVFADVQSSQSVLTAQEETQTDEAPVETPAETVDTPSEPAAGDNTETAPPAGDETPAEGDKAPASDKKGQKERKVSPMMLAALILAPLIIVIIVGAVTIFLKPKDEEGQGPPPPGSRARGSASVKGSKRLQLALELLKAQEIAREGDLETDYFFACLEGANKGENFPVTKYVSTIGRRSTDGRINDIELSSLEKKISRSQAKLVYKKDEEIFYLINESNVPMRVNNEKIIDAYPLKEGDKIEMGGGTVLLTFIRKTYEVVD